MAVDLVEMVPGIYPVSVDYFLKETLKDVFGDEVDSLENISSIVETAAKFKDEEKEMLKPYFSKTAGIK